MTERETVTEAAVEAGFAAIRETMDGTCLNMEDDGSCDAGALCQCRREVRAVLEAAAAGERELLEDVATQFAYRGTHAKRLCLSTGGLSTLETVFATLGWDDPHYMDEGGCEQPGCAEWATCGTPTSDGYKRLCSEHYQAVHRANTGD